MIDISKWLFRLDKGSLPMGYVELVLIRIGDGLYRAMEDTFISDVDLKFDQESKRYKFCIKGSCIKITECEVEHE